MASAMALRSAMPVASDSFFGAFSSRMTPALITFTSVSHSAARFCPQPVSVAASAIVKASFAFLIVPSCPHAPVALERAADVVRGGIGDDELRPAVLRVEDGVLAEDAAEGDRL